MESVIRRTMAAVILAGCIGVVCCGSGIAKDKPQAGVNITEQEIEKAPAPVLPEDKGEHFTIGSYKDDIERIQGEPDEKYFDGDEMVWYYGPDAVYFDFYGRIRGVDNKDGKLKVD